MVKIKANGNEIALLTSDTDYISLTDIAKYKDSENPRYIIQNWLRNKSTIEFLGVWIAILTVSNSTRLKMKQGLIVLF